VKPVHSDPVVLLYQSGTRFHLIVDALATPAGEDGPAQTAISWYMPLVKEWNETLFRDAYESGRRLPLPEEAYRTLANLQTRKVVVRWRDPVTGLGHGRGLPQGSVSLSSPVGGRSDPPDARSDFPFDLSVALPPGRVDLKDDPPAASVQVVAGNPSNIPPASLPIIPPAMK
jgi:hypothetical protein